MEYQIPKNVQHITRYSVQLAVVVSCLTKIEVFPSGEIKDKWDNPSLKI